MPDLDNGNKRFEITTYSSLHKLWTKILGDDYLECYKYNILIGMCVIFKNTDLGTFRT